MRNMIVRSRGVRRLADIKSWCGQTSAKVNSHNLIYLEANSAALPSAIAAVASVVPGHYAAADRIADILRRLGKTSVADYVQTKLPQSARSRSGDLGEILATSYVTEFTGYGIGVYKADSTGRCNTPKRRLRWAFGSGGRIDVDDRYCGHLVGHRWRGDASVSCSGQISRLE